MSVQAAIGRGVALSSDLTGAAIDRSSPVPFYFQLAELLEHQISSSRWNVGERLPSEPALCAQFNLSRTTIRQALARLEQEGLITRDKGRGTFVAHSRPRSWLIQTTEGFFQEQFIRTGHRVTSRILRIERTTLPPWATHALRLPDNSEGAVVERVRAVDGLVALYCINCLPATVAEFVLGLGPDESLYQRLAETRSIHVTGGRRTIESVSAGDRLASLLEINPTDPVAYIESVAWDSTGQTVDSYRAWLRTDRMRIDLSVSTEVRDGVQFPDVVAVGTGDGS